jgi:hypothetical protein
MSFSVRIPAKRKYTLWERIQEAVSCFESDGVSISMASISKFDSAIYVISDIIEIEKFPYNDEKKRSQVRKALRRFNSYSIKKLDYFLRALNTELRRAKKQPRQKFSIVFPLNMHINSFQHKRWIELLDYRLRFYPEQAVAKKFSLEDAKRDVGHHVAGKLPDYSRFVHIVIDAEAASPC